MCSCGPRLGTKGKVDSGRYGAMPGVAHAHQTSNSAGKWDMCELSSTCCLQKLCQCNLSTADILRLQTEDVLQLSKMSAGCTVQAFWSCKPSEYLS